MDLVCKLLSIDPNQRPGAGAVMDTLAMRGFSGATLTAETLRGRARVAFVPDPDTGPQLDRWLSSGGPIAIVGPVGTGRSTALRALSLELRARGRVPVTMQGSGVAWAATSAALAEMGCSLPEAPDRLTRIDDTLDLFAARRVVVLAHDLASMDPESQELVRELAQRKGDLCVTGERAPDFLERVVETRPMGRSRTGSLLGMLLGDGGDQDEIVRAVSEGGGALPGRVVEILCRALESGALLRSGRSWCWDASRAPEIDDLDVKQADLSGLSTGARRLATVCGLLPGGILQAAARQAVRLEDEAFAAAVDELAARGLLRAEGDRLRPEAAAARQLVKSALDAPRVRESLVRVLATRADSAPEVITALALDNQDADSVAKFAEAGVQALIPIDPVGAARMATRVWKLAPVGALVPVTIDALTAAGRVDDAANHAEAALEHVADVDLAQVAIRMAMLEVDLRQRPEIASFWVIRARNALGDQALPDQLRLVEASISALLREPERCLELLEPLISVAPPASGPALTRWLQARVTASTALHQMGDLPRAISVLRDVPREVGRGTGPRARLDASAGRVLWLAGRYSEADEALAAAADRGAGLGLADRARMLNNIGAARYQLGRREAGVAAWEQALALFERLGSEREITRCSANLCLGYRDLGRWARAWQVGRTAVERTARSGDDDLRANALINYGELALVTGDRLRAREFLEGALGVTERADLDRERVEVLVLLARLAVEERDPCANEHVARALAAARAADSTLDAAKALAQDAILLARAGATAAVLDDRAEAALAPVKEAGAAAALAEIRCELALAMIEAGRPSEARSYLDQARTYGEESGSVPLIERIDRLHRALAEASKEAPVDDRLMEMVRLAVVINEQHDVGTVLDQIARAGREMLGGDRAFVLNAEGELQASVFEDSDQGTPSMSVVQQVLKSGREVVAADVGERADLRAQQSVSSMSVRSVYCTPLRHRDQTLGVLYVDSRDVRRRDLWQGVQLMRGLAALAAVAIRKALDVEESMRRAELSARLAEREQAARILAEKNAQLTTMNERLARSAVTDALTGLANRRRLTEVLTTFDARLSRREVGYGIIILDIDHFKRINDTWGHPVGDAVLRWVATGLRALVREEDRVFRFGGEEMVIIMDDPKPQHVEALAERVRANLESRPFEVSPGVTHRVTASLGAALARRGMDRNWEQVLNRADQALYVAKSEGRNRVVLAQPEKARDSQVA